MADDLLPCFASLLKMRWANQGTEGASNPDGLLLDP